MSCQFATHPDAVLTGFVQDCFLGLIECFICFGTSLPIRYMCLLLYLTLVLPHCRVLQSESLYGAGSCHRSYAAATPQDCCECCADIVCECFLPALFPLHIIDIVPSLRLPVRDVLLSAQSPRLSGDLRDA